MIKKRNEESAKVWWGENENQEQRMDCAEMGSEDVGNPTGESFIRSLM
jgi:hypothetical protein